MTILISFIIPHKGREELLLQTVESILKQNTDSNQIEIHIVTQNDNLDVLNKYLDANQNLKVHFQPENKTISALRNYGADAAIGEYLAFIDADIMLDKNWVEVTISELNSHSRRVIISTTQRNSEAPAAIENIRTALNNIYKDSNVDSLPGSNLLIRTEDFRNSCKFPEKLTTCEDIYFTNQMHKQGDLYVTSKTSHIHLGEDKSFTQLFQKEIWRGQSNILSMKGREIPIKELPSIIIPIGTLVLLIMSFAAFASGYIYAALLLILCLLLPFIAYSLRLYAQSQNPKSFSDIFKFYLVYFPARTIGTIGGLFKSFSNSGIN